MPWKKADVESHIKGLDDKQKQAWVKIANSTLSSCLADGGDDCEGKAIRVANAMSKEVKESVSELTEVGKTISAATETQIRTAISALEALLAQPQEEAAKDSDGGGSVDREEESLDADLTGDFVPLVEKAVRADGTVPIRVIAPGWGASGYYSPTVLERDGPNVFTKGLHMHLDHPTSKEESERPERSVKDLAAVLVDNAKWNPQGLAGPGLYADAKVFEPYQSAINELAPHIGVSIRAIGKATHGEAEGRKGNIIEGITAAKSIDFVTAAGAGGEILQLFEAARGRIQNQQEVEVMDAEELKALQEAKEAVEAENARLKEILLLREAQDVVRDALAKVEMPDLTRARLADGLAKNPPVAEGKLDTEELLARIQEAAKTELEYLAKVGGAGKVRGMGSGGGGNGPTDLKESFKNLYARQGKSAEEAEKLATLAAAGR